MSDTIPASQLLYTNVEIDLSPTGRRGFQIWLCSASLTESQRLDVAKRLDDFQLPDATADPMTLIRHVFFQLSDGQTVIARTVPLTTKDRFGRGGRFFAHALIVRADDFARIGANPFRILDGPFRFFASPDEVLAAGIDWRPGTLPETALPVADESNHDAPSELTQTIFADVVSWLPLDEGRNIAIAERPDVVLHTLRDLFRFLPPDLRALCSFDTLSTGEHLSKLPYRIAGSYSPSLLRCWVFKKFHRLELAPPKLAPPLERATASLRTTLVVHWLMHPIADDQKIAALELLDALEENRLADCGPERLHEETLCDLTSIDGFIDRVENAIRQRLITDLNTRLAAEVREQASAYFDGLSSQCLHRLTLPIPEEVLAEWLLTVFAPLRPPTKAQLDALLDWLRGRPQTHVRQLVMIASRWIPAQLPKLIESLRKIENETELTRWFRSWCLDTMQPEWQNETGLRQIGRDVVSGELDETLAEERELFLTLHPHDQRESIRWLQFWALAEDRNTVAMEAILREDEWLYEKLYGDWLADITLVPRWVCYGSPEEMLFFLGYDLVPPTGDGPRIIPVLRLLADLDKRRFFDTWFLFASPPEEVCQGVFPTHDSANMTHARERMNRYYTEERYHRIGDLLPKVEDRVFATLINEFLIGRVLANPEKLYISDHRFWVGLRLRLMEPNRRDYHLVEGILESLLPMKTLDARIKDDEEPPSATYRLRWLMARLRHPRMTERLPLNRNGW